MITVQTRDNNADCVLTAFADKQFLKLVALCGRTTREIQVTDLCRLGSSLVLNQQ
jgi:hypothetical protein